MPGVITTQWVTFAQAQRATGYGTELLNKLVAEGRITVFQVPGMPRRFSRADIEKLLATYSKSTATQA